MNTPLKIERNRRNLSGEDLARAVGITQSYVARLETGKSRPSLPVAKRIAAYFGNAVTRDMILFPEDYVDLPPKKTPPQRLSKAS